MPSQIPDNLTIVRQVIEGFESDRAYKDWMHSSIRGRLNSGEPRNAIYEDIVSCAIEQSGRLHPDDIVSRGAVTAWHVGQTVYWLTTPHISEN